MGQIFVYFTGHGNLTKFTNRYFLPDENFNDFMNDVVAHLERYAEEPEDGCQKVRDHPESAKRAFATITHSDWWNISVPPAQSDEYIEWLQRKADLGRVPKVTKHTLT